MSIPKTVLIPDQFYHIYNRGTNGCPIFREISNYEHFLRLYEKHISIVADTYAWVLMGNHFHLLVRIKRPDLEGLLNLEGLDLIKRINQQFSNLFNAYSKAYNKRYQRSGSLFEHTFHRKKVCTKNHLKRIIIYIHNNPVHHGFCDHAVEYPWSSYLSYVEVQSRNDNHDKVMGWFDSKANFHSMHKSETEIDLNLEGF